MSTNLTTTTIREAATGLATEYDHQLTDVLAWMDINPAQVDIDDQSIGCDAQGLEELRAAYSADHARIESERS
jgi:hypothetical protein